MICDRTLQDVTLAKTIRAVLQSGGTLTEAQAAALERGTCTVNTLNRIEQKQAELNQLLCENGYCVDISNVEEWAYDDVFTYQDHQRILENLNVLKDAFYVYDDTPTTPDYMFSWSKANDIEKILVDIESMLEDMIDRFRECGTFECGEDNEL